MIMHYICQLKITMAVNPGKSGQKLSRKEKKILLLKLDTFITGYGHFIAKGLEPFDEEVYRSMFNDLLGGYKHD